MSSNWSWIPAEGESKLSRNTEEVPMDTVTRLLLAKLAPMMAELALEHFQEIEDFMMAQAAKTTETQIDDYICSAMLGWARSYLQDYVGKVS